MHELQVFVSQLGMDVEPCTAIRHGLRMDAVMDFRPRRRWVILQAALLVLLRRRKDTDCFVQP